MAILHGSWLVNRGQGGLFVWGETWRRTDAIAVSPDSDILPHPLAMTATELSNCLRDLQQQEQLSGSLPAALLAALEAPAEKKRAKKKAKTATKTKSTTIRVKKTEPSADAVSWQSQTVALPAKQPTAKKKKSKKAAASDFAILPLHSAAIDDPDTEPEQADPLLYPWQVEGLYLPPDAALQFLRLLPLGAVDSSHAWLGGDLRFWSHIARWSLDLLARAKFLPALELPAEDAPIARWYPLLDSSTDRARLEQFARTMPDGCRVYQANVDGEVGSVKESEGAIASPLTVPLLLDPKRLLGSFLGSLLDKQVRAIAMQQAMPNLESPLREWLQSLSSKKATVAQNADACEHLATVLSTWTTPLQQYQNALPFASSFRTAFILHPPGDDGKTWRLEYGLQAADDANFLLDARTIWQHPVERLIYRGRPIEQPQETLLGSLGLASRIYPPLDTSLQTAAPEACELDPMQAYEFLKSAAWRLQDSGFGVVLPPSLANREGWASRLGLKIRAQTARSRTDKNRRIGLEGLLNFKWELSIGGQTLSKAEFDRLVALDSPLVEINGEWVELRSQDIKTAQNFFATRKDKMNLSLEDALRISTGDTHTVDKLPVVDFEASGALQGLIETLTSNQTLEPLEEPAGFRGELRPYQRRGTAWLTFLERWGLGACLADDMGLGKTIQLIAFLLHLQEADNLDAPTLLICPTSVLGNWEREVKRFGPSLKTLVYHGDKRPQKKAFKPAVKDKQLVITSYALVYRDRAELHGIEWRGIVLDEAQNIKNPESKQSQAVRDLEGQFRIALTGTPVENRLSELWSIMDFLNPGYLGPRNFFQRRFAMPIERYGDTDSLNLLRSFVQPFLLRRLKTDRDIIQDLPEKQEMNVFCGLSAEQAALYQKTVDQSMAEIDEAGGIQRRGMILGLLVKLKQICNHPAHFLSENSLGSSQRSGKLQRLEEMLDEIVATGDAGSANQAERALIFTQFAEWGKLLKAYLERQTKREVFFLYGSSSKKQREDMVDRFQHDPQGPRVMILSLKAGGVGLNLTRANHVFHFDRWWNPAVENQATDRVFRIGQTRNVQVHKFVCTGTLEEKIHDLIESKRALAEQVVGTGEQWLTELDTDRLRDLLLLDRSAVMDEEVKAS